MLMKSVLAAAALLASSAAASAAVPDAKVTYDIAFSGFCDGMSLTVYKGIYVTGMSTGCLSGVDQGLNTSVNKFSGLVVTGNQEAAPSLYTYSLDLTNMRWAVYSSDGTTYFKINSGKFTFGAPAAKATRPSSVTKQ